MTSPAGTASARTAPVAIPLGRENLLPLLLTLALVGAALAWNMAVGLAWRVPLTAILAVPVACLGLAAFYCTVRPDPAIAEMALYVGLWFLYPVFGTHLTYLANSLGFPLRDALFAGWDAALGFHWLDWARFVAAHPHLRDVQAFAYESCLWQAPLIVALLALRGPRGRNAEFLTAMLVALTITIAANMLWPSLGPAAFNGVSSDTADIIRRLRDGAPGPFAYAGIIPFPSFHTVIALLYTAALRGRRILFPAALALNAMMLSAIPFSGNHYLVDIIAGAAIALLSLGAARQCCAR